MKRLSLVTVSMIALLAAPALAQQAAPVIEQHSVAGHIGFLAGEELRGRGSATHDEAVAAAYVAAQFRIAGLTTVPGMDSHFQRAPLIKSTPSGTASLTVGDVVAQQGGDLTLLSRAVTPVSGPFAVAAGTDPADIPTADIVLITPAGGQGVSAQLMAARQKGAKLIVVRATEELAGMVSRGATGPSYRLADTPVRGGAAMVMLAAEAFDRIAAAGGSIAFDPGQSLDEAAVTTNAMGWLQGTDPAAGVLLISAHLDHVGVRPDGTIMYGANDDGSGTVAVIELAHALAAMGPHKRSIMFAAYGAEEVGLLGSRYFVDNPPIPLTDIAANLEIEMIGDQDPQLPPGVMMMTGFERSDFGPALKERGALVGPDPYPEQNFFQRSDNYALALKGIVAHTISGWATIPTYHTVNDTIENLNIPFMTAAIQSLVEPLAQMADGEFTPEWAEGGRPEPR